MINQLYYEKRNEVNKRLSEQFKQKNRTLSDMN